eukprot:4729048-Alexandrium_andersonii.AAC.1
MSASLVGSEMCIRDSSGSLLGSPESRLEGSQKLSGCCLGAIRGLTEPVSYTHLTLPTICSV